jgi:hypothetical protein
LDTLQEWEWPECSIFLLLVSGGQVLPHFQNNRHNPNENCSNGGLQSHLRVGIDCKKMKIYSVIIMLRFSPSKSHAGSAQAKVIE